MFTAFYHLQKQSDCNPPNTQTQSTKWNGITIIVIFCLTMDTVHIAFFIKKYTKLMNKTSFHRNKPSSIYLERQSNFGSNSLTIPFKLFGKISAIYLSWIKQSQTTNIWTKTADETDSRWHQRTNLLIYPTKQKLFWLEIYLQCI